MELLLKTMKDLQAFLNVLASLDIGYWSLNFLASSTVAYISFPLYYFFEHGESPNLLRQIQKVSQQTKDLRRDLVIFTLRYACVTGFCTAALISIQFGSLNLKSAILYGMLGPYFVRDMLFGKLRENLQREMPGIINDVSRKVDKISSEKYDLYKSKLDEISGHLTKE